MFYAAKLTPKSIISKNVIAYLSNTKIIFVDLFSFLKMLLLRKPKMLISKSKLLITHYILTLGTPNFSSL
jgi:hypothetical protein